MFYSNMEWIHKHTRTYEILYGSLSNSAAQNISSCDWPNNSSWNSEGSDSTKNKKQKKRKEETQL